MWKSFRSRRCARAPKCPQGRTADLCWTQKGHTGGRLTATYTMHATCLIERLPYVCVQGVPEVPCIPATADRRLRRSREEWPPPCRCPLSLWGYLAWGIGGSLRRIELAPARRWIVDPYFSGLTSVTRESPPSTHIAGVWDHLLFCFWYVKSWDDVVESCKRVSHVLVCLV